MTFTIYCVPHFIQNMGLTRAQRSAAARKAARTRRRNAQLRSERARRAARRRRR